MPSEPLNSMSDKTKLTVFIKTLTPLKLNLQNMMNADTNELSRTGTSNTVYFFNCLFTN